MTGFAIYWKSSTDVVGDDRRRVIVTDWTMEWQYSSKNALDEQVWVTYEADADTKKRVLRRALMKIPDEHRIFDVGKI